jgi:hypothetical protein
MEFIHYVEKITGVSIYGLISFLLFGSFFIIVSIWALRADKKMINEIKNIPLDKNS